MQSNFPANGTNYLEALNTFGENVKPVVDAIISLMTLCRVQCASLQEQFPDDVRVDETVNALAHKMHGQCKALAASVVGEENANKLLMLCMGEVRYLDHVSEILEAVSSIRDAVLKAAGK